MCLDRVETTIPDVSEVDNQKYQTRKRHKLLREHKKILKISSKLLKTHIIAIKSKKANRLTDIQNIQNYL